MGQGFLEREAKRAYKRNKRLYFSLALVYVVLVTMIVFAVKDSIDFNNYRDQKLVICFYVFSGLMLIFVISGVVISKRQTMKGKCLQLPFEENTKEAVAMMIDQEIAEGKILADEYLEEFPLGRKPHGPRVILLPSYLLCFVGMGRILAIPRDKIYWICPQAGMKGRSSFIVRLQIFTEKKVFYLEGTNVEHVKNIADKLYQYIPDVFSAYDPFTLSYELEKLFDKRREEFLRFYEEEKKKCEKSR